MKIRKIETKKTFIIDCKEHNAEFECETNELRLVSKHVLAYTCPVCGNSHIVPSYRVTESTHYRHDVELDDSMLPVNIAKAAAAADEALRKEFRKLKRQVRSMRAAGKAKKPVEPEMVTPKRADRKNVPTVVKPMAINGIPVGDDDRELY